MTSGSRCTWRTASGSIPDDWTTWRQMDWICPTQYGAEDTSNAVKLGRDGWARVAMSHGCLVLPIGTVVRGREDYWDGSAVRVAVVGNRRGMRLRPEGADTSMIALAGQGDVGWVWPDAFGVGWIRDHAGLEKKR
jgi:hypothetical protein